MVDISNPQLSGFFTIKETELLRAEMYGWILVGRIIGTDRVTIQRQRSNHWLRDNDDA